MMRVSLSTVAVNDAIVKDLGIRGTHTEAVPGGVALICGSDRSSQHIILAPEEQMRLATWLLERRMGR